MNALVAASLAFLTTVAGGILALKAKPRLHLVLGFTAGVLLGVVAFDVLPEIVELNQSLGRSIHASMIALVAGFLAFHAAEKLLLIHHGQEDTYAGHHHPAVGFLSALALAGHSFLDGRRCTEHLRQSPSPARANVCWRAVWPPLGRRRVEFRMKASSDAT
jgi:zinc transporter ZupT